MGLGLGLGIWWPTQTSIIPGLLKALCARATYCENKTCTTAILEEIASVRYTAPPPPPPPGLLLEDYPGASAAYSLRNLIDTTTSVVRVRRSSDNTEQDFTSAEITDGTLIAFTGANDGFITTWYDQSGNSNNLTQAVAIAQPNLVSSGIIELSNNKPTIFFDAALRHAKYFEQTVDLSPLEVEHFLVIQSLLYPPTDIYNTGLYTYSGEGTFGGTHYPWTDGDIYDSFGTTSRKNVGTPPETLAKLNLYNVLSKSSKWSARLNTTEFFTTSSNSVGWTGNQSLGKTKPNDGYYFSGFISEFIIYPSDQSANRASIETNINTEYTIY